MLHGLKIVIGAYGWFYFEITQISPAHLYSVGFQPSFNSIALELWANDDGTVVATDSIVVTGSFVNVGATIEAVSFSGAGLAVEPLK